MSFDKRFKFDIFYEDWKELLERTSTLHTKKLK